MRKTIKKISNKQQKIINYISGVISLVILCFIVFWAYELFSLTFKSGDSKFFKTMVGSFAGAFFAFLFLRVGEVFEKYYKRQVKHFNALVGMEISLDELRTIIHDNIYLLPTFRSTINSGNVFISTIRPLPIRSDYYEQLNDTDLINDLYQLNYDIRRINDDLESAHDWYLHLRQIYTTNQISASKYVENAKILSQNLKIIQAALTILLDDVINFEAKTKIRIDYDKPLLTKFMHQIFDKTRKDIHANQIKQKTSLLKEEIANSGKDSRSRIGRIKQMVDGM